MPLPLYGDLPRDTIFLTSVRSVALDLGTLELKKDMIDDIVRQMKNTWYFRKADGTYLSASTTNTSVERWPARSIWDGKRWVRDETEPGFVWYFVATVCFRYERGFTTERKALTLDLQATAISSRSFAWSRPTAFVYKYLLESLGLPVDTPTVDTCNKIPYADIPRLSNLESMASEKRRDSAI
ncbi:hypothetical protein AMS68_007172 [Peltaster fructicola]|uniref:Uncharacterized protein n=1 Tax=Peltaster fructicola TaxID=286661 RepID=A0A6H0Y401_9PEZI|nr:hypothetical protein AMS68_007172 [Peltaster fructicola]